MAMAIEPQSLVQQAVIQEEEDPAIHKTGNSVSSLFELVSKNKGQLSKPHFDDNQLGAGQEEKVWESACTVSFGVGPNSVPLIGRGQDKKKKVAHSHAAEAVIQEYHRLQVDPNGYTPNTYPEYESKQYSQGTNLGKHKRVSNHKPVVLVVDTVSMDSVLPLADKSSMEVHAFVMPNYSGFRTRGVSVHEAKFKNDDSVMMSILWWISKSVSRMRNMKQSLFIASGDPRLQFAVQTVQDSKIQASMLYTHQEVEQLLAQHQDPSQVQQHEVQQHEVQQHEVVDPAQVQHQGTPYIPEDASLQLPQGEQAVQGVEGVGVAAAQDVQDVQEDNLGLEAPPAKKQKV